MTIEDISLSPYQEWRLHNGEGPVPEWFVQWTQRVIRETQNYEYRCLQTIIDKRMEELSKPITNELVTD